ncbi:tRNA 4-thiouridine(8) synthase ThiI [Deltaproteobacteria bacterium Smac51]|nr:tRNA 4-thiouridine(8) synthase ThiI [Deltaproteobacteria bacterium Smac51]
MEQNITPDLITFTTPFFPPDKAIAAARELGLEVTQIDIYGELLSLIKNPVHGLGKNMNPCIDCHALMFRKAGEILAESGEDGFLFSGEVVGQRPMSQNSHSLRVVARDSGQSGRILRPLSAKLMPETEAEEKGLVDRERLLNLSGRGRRPQIALAEKYGLSIPPPAGGCLLTDPMYSRRLKWLLQQRETSDTSWPPARLAEMIKRGRIFSAEPGQWLVVGRNQADNQALDALMEKGDTFFHLEGGPGPTVLLPDLNIAATEATFSLGRSLAAAYGDNGGADVVMVRMGKVGDGHILVETEVTKPARWGDFMEPKECD